VASGVWSLQEQELAKKAGAWPNNDPTLALDFDETTTLDSRITFTRATNGTYFDSSGVLQTASSGAARFDHRLESGVWVNKGLLIEEQRTNLFQRSEEFDNAYWTKQNSTVTANDIAAPDNTTTADKVLETTTNGIHGVSRSVTFTSTSASPTTMSVFIKGGLGRNTGFMQFYVNSGSVPAVSLTFNLSTVSVSGSAGGGATNLSSSIVDVGNGWYRLSLSGYTGQTSAIHLCDFLFGDSPFTYAGDVTKGFYLWGAQVEAGAFPTSYIKTTSASVTRNADVAVMTGTDFSDWYNATEGSVFWQGQLIGASNALKRGYAFSNNTVNEFMIFTPSNTSNLISVTSVQDGGVDQATLISPDPRLTVVANQTYKHGFAYKVNDFAATLDGISPATDTSGTLPTVDRLYLGVRYDGASERLNGHIAKFYYWNTRKSNFFLQNITS